MVSLADLFEETRPERHLVQLYGDDDRLLITNVGRYLLEGLKRGDALLVITTPERRESFVRELDATGAEPMQALRQGRLVFCDARETLAGFMVDGHPDQDRFDRVVGSAVRAIRARNGSAAGLRAYGDMVGLLWDAGQRSAAIRLEQLWNDLLRIQACSLFCAYPIDVFGRDFEIGTVDALMCAHTHLVPATADLETAVEWAMDEVLGPRAERMRPLMKANYRPSWAEISRAEALVLWLRNNLPDDADAILARARDHHEAFAPSPCPDGAR